MVTVYAEKFDVGSKIAAALSGFTVDGKTVDLSNIETVKDKIKASCNKKGYIEINYKGEDYCITWGQGHMCGLKNAKDYNPEYINWKNIPLPFVPEKYEIKIREQINRETGKGTGEPDPWAKRQLDIVKSLFERSDYVINATDDDREGEVIFAYVYEWCNVDVPYKRVVLNSQTKEGFIEAFDNLKSSDDVKNIEAAGRGRQIADWIVGINLSTIMSIKYGGGGTAGLISIGRVQTPTLNILVKRENEIKNFVSHPFWNLKATFTTGTGQTYEGKHKIAQIEDKTKAEAILNKIQGKPGIVTEYKSTLSESKPPLLYNLTSLSMEANKKYGITAAQTLEIAQELYSAGYLTYPRTSSQCLTDDMKNVVDNTLEQLKSIPEYKDWIEAVPKESRNYTKRHFNSANVESHFAIIPTTSIPKNLTENQKKIYDLCAKSLIRIIYKNAQIEKTSITTTVKDEEFTSSGSVIKDAQWMAVDAMPDSETILPPITEGENVSGEYKIHEGKTKPPERYTDTSLLAALRNAGKDIEEEELKNIMLQACEGGIGTEATRAGIIETVINRYAYRKGKNIIPTEKGMKLIEILPVDELKVPDLTANFEMQLDKIAKGSYDLSQFIQSIEDTTKKWVDIINSSEVTEKLTADTNIMDINCPVCGKPLKKYSWGWACSGYSKTDENSCKFAISSSVNGVTLKESDLKDLITNKKTRFLSGFKKKDSTETFSAFLILDGNNKLKPTWDVGKNCPVCGKPLVVSPFGWGCSGYKDGCTFSIANTIAGKKISDKDKQDLIASGKTKLIKGFTSKSGKTFDAYLEIKDNKVSFNFGEKK